MRLKTHTFTYAIRKLTIFTGFPDNLVKKELSQIRTTRQKLKGAYTKRRQAILTRRNKKTESPMIETIAENVATYADVPEIEILLYPEYLLHPSQQKKVVEVLVELTDKKRVITFTHSEHVINAVRVLTMQNKISHEDVVIYFVREEEEGKIVVTPIELTRYGDLTEFPKNFFDQVAIDMAEIIRKKRELLKYAD